MVRSLDGFNSVFDEPYLLCISRDMTEIYHVFNAELVQVISSLIHSTDTSAFISLSTDDQGTLQMARWKHDVMQIK